MNYNCEKRVISKETQVFLVFLICALLFQLKRVCWGIADVDESSYLAIPYRLIQGDALLAEEWHLSQLSAVLVYPILKLYLYFAESTEGIILNFRYIYIVIQLIVTIVSYWLLSKKNRLLACCSSIMFFMFCPFNIMALSYNTLGLDFIYLYSVIIIECNGHKICRSFISGIILALAILCNPYLLIVYVFYTIIMLGQLLCKHQKQFLWQWIYLTIGLAIIGLLIVGFIFSRASLYEIIENLPFILNNPSHEAKTMRSFFKPIVDFYKEYWYYTLLVGGSLGVGMFIKPIRKFCFMIATIVSMAVCVYWATNVTNKIGYAAIMSSLTPLGFAAFMYSKEKDLSLIAGYMLGIIYAICMNLASNTGVYAIFNACTVSSCVSIWMIKYYIDEEYKFSWKSIIFFTIIVLQLFSERYIYNHHVFWEDSPQTLTSEIEAGPLKGIFTTEEKSETYNFNYSNLSKIKEKYDYSDNNLLLYRAFPCGYLMMNHMRTGAYSSWLYDVANTPDDIKIKKYYQMHPKKLPDVVYIDIASAKVWEDEQWIKYAESNDYNYIRYKNGGWMFYR